MIETGHAHDDLRRVPVYSLYSETREPTAEMLKGLDVLVVDLQDVGHAHLHLHLHDGVLPDGGPEARPPGHRLRSAQPDRRRQRRRTDARALASNRSSVCIRSRCGTGMTIGELARLFNEHFGIGAKLEVVQMEGWRREMYHDDAGAPWVMPSPNMPTLDTAIVYPGTVLFEGTNVSEGRGTTRPFELIGAPWVIAEPFAAALNRRDAGWRRLPSGGVRADLSQTRERVVRRMPASRDRPQDVPARSGGRSLIGGVSEREPRTLPLARSTVRVRA